MKIIYDNWHFNIMKMLQRKEREKYEINECKGYC